MRAAEEMATAGAEKVDTEVALAKAGGEEGEENIDVVKIVEDAKYRERIPSGEPNIGEQNSATRPSNKLTEKKFGEDWLVKQAIELLEQVQQRPTRRNKESAARETRKFH